MGILDRLAKGAESIVEGAADVAGSRAVTGITTGLLSAKIKNSEANDALKANVLARVGDTLLSETIPNAIEAEKNRKTNYKLLESKYNTNFANVADASQFTLNDDTMKQLEELLKENKLDEEALKNAKFETDFNTRYQTRTQTFEEKYNPILKKLGIDNIGALGYNTVESLVGNKQPMQMKTEDMAKGPVPSDAFSSMQVRDYLDPLVSTTDLGTPNQVDQAIAGYRGFNQGIIRDASGQFAGIELFGEKANERNAFKAVMTRIASNYKIKGTEKADLTATALAANKVLFDQTQGYIGDQVLDGYKAATFKEKIQGKNFDINRYNATQFSESFNAANPTDNDKIDTLVSYMFDDLQTRSERIHFAQSFAANIKDSAGNSYRNLLLIALDPTLIPAK
jgi:hypothetical protein